jgi:hypothetical protein
VNTIAAVLSLFLGPKGLSKSQMYLIPAALKSKGTVINKLLNLKKTLMLSILPVITVVYARFLSLNRG